MESEQRWLTVREAATVLGITESAIRKRVSKGGLDARTGNDGRVRVLVADFPQPSSRPLPEGSDPDIGSFVELREQVVRLEERLAAALELRRHIEELKEVFRARAEELKGELTEERRRAEAAERHQVEQDRRFDDVLRQLEELRADRRRPWPGLRTWWRRLWSGEAQTTTLEHRRETEQEGT